MDSNRTESEEDKWKCCCFTEGVWVGIIFILLLMIIIFLLHVSRVGWPDDDDSREEWSSEEWWD